MYVPIKTRVTGAKYLCSFVDQATRHLTVACFSKKSEAKTARNLYRKFWIQKYFPRGVQTINTDGGGEFFFADDGSPLHTTTAPETPSHNPFAERTNGTVFDHVHTILEESGLSHQHWE